MQLAAVKQYIDAHLADTLSLPTLASIAKVSPFHFHRMFCAIQGETPWQFCTRRRLHGAILNMLQHPQMRLIDIALNHGFASPEHFSRTFKQHVGVSPSQYRKQPFVVDLANPNADEIAMNLSHDNVEII